jgi:hypothetical protein
VKNESRKRELGKEQEMVQECLSKFKEQKRQNEELTSLTI